MISSVTKHVGGRDITFKLSTRAMVSLERSFDQSLSEILDGLQDGFRVEVAVAVLQYAGNDGASMSADQAEDIVDGIGLAETGKLVSEIVAAALQTKKK